MMLFPMFPDTCTELGSTFQASPAKYEDVTVSIFTELELLHDQRHLVAIMLFSTLLGVKSKYFGH